MLNEYTNNLIVEKDEEEYLLENFNYEQLCNLKHNEIISSFRMGYSVQERIIELIKNEKKFIEYPNLIFYQNNDDNLYYKEIDRVLFLQESTEFKLFKIYLSILNDKEEIYDEGRILKLNGDSLNFIEIKRSIYSFEKQISEHEKKNSVEKEKGKSEKGENVSASKNSYLNKDRTDLYYSIKNIKVFLDLYSKIGVKYKEINLLYIFDSNFSLNFIETLIKLIRFEIYNENILFTSFGKINLYFIHIQSDYEKLDIINRNIYKNNLEKTIIELQKDIKEKINKLEKWQNENKDLKERLENENKDLKERLEKENKELKEKFENYENEKLLKKEIKNINLKEILEEENIKKFDILIGKNYHNLEIEKSIDNIDQLNEIKIKNYKTILDTKTFFKKFIDNNNDNFIDYNSYFSMIKDFDRIILIVDHDFLNNYEIMKKYYNRYEIKVIIVDLSAYIVILKDSNLFIEGTCTVKIKNNILPGFKEGEYEFYLDKDLVSYFKKLTIFKTNMTKKINDEILVYFPDNKTFQYFEIFQKVIPTK